MQPYFISVSIARKDKGIAYENFSYNVTVRFIKEGFNTGNGNNMFKFVLTILGVVAEMEHELTVERILRRHGQGEKIRNQVWQADRQTAASGSDQL